MIAGSFGRLTDLQRDLHHHDWALGVPADPRPPGAHDPRDVERGRLTGRECDRRASAKQTSATGCYQREEPHLFTIKGPLGEPVTVECWLNEWATSVDIYIRTSDGDLEPVEYHHFDSPDGANAPEAFAEFDANALRRDLGLPPRVPHPLRDAALAACERPAP